MQIKESLGLTNKQVEGRNQTKGASKASRKEAGASGGQAQAAGGDRVEISGRSREMAQAADAVSSAPVMREQKVAEIKSRIENNQYHVDADKVAQKMIVDFLNELV